VSAHDTDAALLLHDRHVHAVLARVHRQNGHAAVPAPAPLPFEELLNRESGADEPAEIIAAKEEAVMQFISVLWSVGPDPRPVMKRLCAFTRMMRPELVLGMNRTQMAALLGVDVDRTISLTFVMGAALAAVAGLIFTLYYGAVDFFIGFLAGLKAFTAAVLGGIGSLPGAMLGGVLIGLIEAFWSAHFPIAYKDVAVFGILVVVLIFRPTGLLGRPDIEKV
jgi:branched-chain amino acid transport system permease protein